MTFHHQHQYVLRETGAIQNEGLIADSLIRLIYSDAREKTPAVFKALTSTRFTRLLGFLNYDIPLDRPLGRVSKLAEQLGIDGSECVLPLYTLDTARKLFERQIRYWECRPMPADRTTVVSPADAKILCGSLQSQSQFFLKEKFFDLDELLSSDRHQWHHTFAEGDWAILRLTPEKYHYNHFPVSGQVSDLYEIHGRCHSCNPGATVAMATPYSKNKRVVTIIDTNVSRGSRVGIVAMVEVTALMIGEIVQCYSRIRYDAPRVFKIGDFVLRGQPKSLFRPGSSVVVLLFQRGRVRFADDLLRNLMRRDVRSRYSEGFGRPLVETEVDVRSKIAERSEL